MGIAGKGRGLESARRTAAVVNRTHPWLIGANMLTVYENSELYREIVAGNWQEAAEVEKYEEKKTGSALAKLHQAREELPKACAGRL